MRDVARVSLYASQYLAPTRFTGRGEFGIRSFSEYCTLFFYHCEASSLELIEHRDVDRLYRDEDMGAFPPTSQVYICILQSLGPGSGVFFALPKVLWI